MKRWLAQAFLAVMSVAAAFEAQAGWYSVSSWTFAPSPGGGRIALAGGSSDSCIPVRVDPASYGSTIVLMLVPPPPPGGCFFAGMPWDFGVDLPFLVGGTYTVAVRTPNQVADLALFTVVIPAGGAPAPQSIPAGGPLLWGVLGSLLLLVGAARTRDGAATR